MSFPDFAATVYLERDDLATIDHAELGGETFHHLYQVKRLHRDQALRVVDGRGCARLATVSALRHGQATLALAEVLPAHEPELHLRLIVGALKPERAAWLVEKATELGVAELHFVATERTPRQYSHARIDRLLRVAIAALEQCHGARLPQISGVAPWSSFPGWLGAGDNLVLAPGPENAPPPEPPAVQLARPGQKSEVVVFIGPEGGFSARELSELATRGVRSRSWGGRILRVETAAVAAASLLLLGSLAP